MNKLNINANAIQELNKALENAKNAKNWYKVEITEKNKTLKISKSTLEILKNNGVNITKTYYSYNNEKPIFTLLEKVLVENKDIFYNKDGE